MQNKIIRLMNLKYLKDHVEMTTLYKSMHILKINDIYELEYQNLYILTIKIYTFI